MAEPVPHCPRSAVLRTITVRLIALCLAAGGCTPEDFKPGHPDLRRLDAAPVTPSNLDPAWIDPPFQSHNTPPRLVFAGKVYGYAPASRIGYNAPDWPKRVPGSWTALDAPLAAVRKHWITAAAEIEMVLIDIRLVRGVPQYCYLGSAARQDIPYEPWSSGKFMAVSAAASALRLATAGRIGLDAEIGSQTLPDLVTEIHSYQPADDGTARSGARAAWLLDIAGRRYASALLQDGWLGLAKGNRFFGSYGYPSFDPGTTAWTAPDGTRRTILPDPVGADRDHKQLSALAQAEWLKRLVMHHAEPGTRLPGLSATDLRVLFYGTPGTPSVPGGMLAGLSAALPLALCGGRLADAQAIRGHIERQAGPQWRVFHKIGWGISETRERAETVLAGAVALPGFDGGRLVIVAVRTSLDAAAGLEAAYACLQDALTGVLTNLLPDFAPPPGPRTPDGVSPDPRVRP